jgi:hypothetical protein
MNQINIKWARIPKDIREKLLNNVWCVNCSDVVKVTDYCIDEDKVGLVIKGKCKICGHKVCRVVEND